MDKKEPQKEQNVQQQEPNVWVCDAVAVTHCDVSDKGVVYTVTWTDLHSAKVKREDCYFDFANVLKTLVKGGYRYNTMIAQAPAIIQQRLTAFRPTQESVKKAIEAMKK